MKLNWFSPLPPAKTEIGRFTAGILPHLSRDARITLWTDQSDWDPSLNNYAVVRRYQPGRTHWDEINRADLTVYNIGNNPLFHGSIWEVSQRHPGVVVLHDYNLQEFFYSLYLDPWQDLNAYLILMEYYYGEQGRVEAESAFKHKLLPSLIEPYPLTQLGVENALGVVVHSVESLEKLKQTVTCPLTYAPLPSTRAAVEPAADRVDVGRPYRLIVFGYLGPNRRLAELLKVLGEFASQQDFRLDIYGEVTNHNELTNLIRRFALAKQVTLHGFVPESELEQAMSVAQLAINLRYPTAGEASASQLRIWSHSLPSLVTQVGWYATLPENTVGFVRPEHELSDLRDHLGNFFSDPGSFAELGRNGFTLYRQQHLPEQYVQTLLGLVSEAMEFRSVSAWQKLIVRTRLEMANSFDGKISNDAWAELVKQVDLQAEPRDQEWTKRMKQKASLVYGRTPAGTQHFKFSKRLKRLIRMRLPPRVYEYYLSKKAWIWHN
ncbi:MAG TPA: glycosyltransferase [Pyrinomonadaceae bacterium]|nr:glycosyltransferase [Pyrinomonadaceae bacterium]